MKYNTMVDFAFELRHEQEDPYEVPLSDFIQAARARLDRIEQGMEGAKEAFGICDTYEEDET